MDIQFYGANCLVITTKQARVVIDDNLVELGGKSVGKEGDVMLFTGEHPTPKSAAKLVIEQPGEYEVSGVSIIGVAARGHMEEEGKTGATLYKIMNDEVSVIVTGHIYPELTDDQLETIGMVDAMIVPVGGNGYTLDSIGALKLVKKIEPKLVIPTHYGDSKLKFPVPQQTLDEAIKGLSMEPKETVPKLKLKSTELTDTTQLLVLEES